MAKWRASQKARRKQGNLKLESQADSKPYHFDDPNSSKLMEPTTTVSYPVSPTQGLAELNTRPSKATRTVSRSISTPVRRVRNYKIYE